MKASLSCSLHVNVCLSVEDTTPDDFAADELVARFGFCRENKISMNSQLLQAMWYPSIQRVLQRENQLVHMHLHVNTFTHTWTCLQTLLTVLQNHGYSCKRDYVIRILLIFCQNCDKITTDYTFLHRMLLSHQEELLLPSGFSKKGPSINF